MTDRRPKATPRLTRIAVRYPVAVVAAVIVALVAALFGNARVFALRGGILDDALPADDPYRRMDDAVRAKASQGFEAGEIVPIVVKLRPGSVEDLRYVVDLTREAKRTFGKNVMSLATIPDYRDDGTTLVTDAYLTDDRLASFDERSADDLRRRVAADPTVAGIFVAKDWSWASIAILLPPGYDEIAEAWRIVEFVEGRPLSPLERFFRADVHPRDPRLAVAGWTMGRWQIGQGINRDLMLLVALGVVSSLPIGWWYLKSLRQALVGAIVIACGIFFTRAAIAALHWLGLGTYERVYTELAYANVIVQGTSFSLHWFEAFRASRAPRSAEKLLDASAIAEEIRLVVLIATIGFGCLFTFPVWQMREMAVESITGVAILYVETLLVLPAIYLVLERVFGPEDLARHYHPAQFGFARLVGRLRAPVWLAWIAPPLAFATAAALFTTGAVATRTLPEEYIEGTLIGETFDVFAASGSGNEFLDLLVEPKAGSVRDPRFLDAAWRLQRALSSPEFETWQPANGVEPARVEAVGSILGKVHQVARETYGQEMPASEQEAIDAFAMIEEALPLEIRRQLWFDGGIRLLVSAEMNDSHALRALVERILRFAAETHGDVLSAQVFGKAPVYPQVDRYITRGEGPNVLTSLLLIFAVYAAWIAWHGRRLEARRAFRFAVGGYVMVAPFMFSTGVMACLMAWRGVALSMSTAPIGDLAINAAGDFSVYFYAAFMSAYAYDRRLAAAVDRTCTRESIVVAVDCLLNAVSFSPLLFSRFKPVRELGWMMIAMLGATLVGLLIFLPSLLPATIRKETETVERR